MICCSLSKKFNVSSNDVYPSIGTPVVCNGMDSSPCINGKIGEVVSFDCVKDCYEIRFRDHGLWPCMVKRESLRILFELPEE